MKPWVSHRQKDSKIRRLIAHVSGKKNQGLSMYLEMHVVEVQHELAGGHCQILGYGRSNDVAENAQVWMDRN